MSVHSAFAQCICTVHLHSAFSVRYITEHNITLHNRT